MAGMFMPSCQGLFEENEEDDNGVGSVTLLTAAVATAAADAFSSASTTAVAVETSTMKSVSSTSTDKSKSKTTTTTTTTTAAATAALSRPSTVALTKRPMTQYQQLYRPNDEKNQTIYHVKIATLVSDRYTFHETKCRYMLDGVIVSQLKLQGTLKFVSKNDTTAYYEMTDVPTCPSPSSSSSAQPCLSSRRAKRSDEIPDHLKDDDGSETDTAPKICSSPSSSAAATVAATLSTATTSSSSLSSTTTGAGAATCMIHFRFDAGYEISLADFKAEEGVIYEVVAKPNAIYEKALYAYSIREVTTDHQRRFFEQRCLLEDEYFKTKSLEYEKNVIKPVQEPSFQGTIKGVVGKYNVESFSSSSSSSSSSSNTATTAPSASKVRANLAASKRKYVGNGPKSKFSVDGYISSARKPSKPSKRRK